MVEYNPEEFSFVNQVFQAGKFPVDPDYSKGVYKVESLGPNLSRLTVDIYYRMKPGFMGGMMKGSFKKLMSDYMIGLEHNIKTGEVITKDNFREIKRKY